MGVRAALAVGALVLLGGLSAAPAQAASPPTLKIEVIGQGTVTGFGINCGLGNLACYTAYGTDPQPVTLTATPNTGWTFSHWEDLGPSCTTSNPCALSGGAGVTGNVTATAVFTAPVALQTATFGVALTTEGTTAHGAVASNSTNYPINCAQGAATSTACSLTVVSGSTITVVETPDAATAGPPATPPYFFAGWGGACTGRGQSCSV